MDIFSKDVYAIEKMRTDIESIEFMYMDYGLGTVKLVEIEKCICQIAKKIFPELKDLENDIFTLKKQRIWINRNHENLNTEFLDYYQRLINLQRNVKSSRQEVDNLLDIPLEVLPSTNPAKNHTLEEKNSKDVFVQSLESSMSEVGSFVSGSADENLKKDKEVVFAAVKLNGLALQYADESLKKDKEVILAAVKQNGLALQYADESLKKDKEVIVL